MFVDMRLKFKSKKIFLIKKKLSSNLSKSGSKLVQMLFTSAYFN